MKIIRSFTAAALVLFACGHHEDTAGGGMWRTVEPRLSVTGKWSPCTRKPPAPKRVVFEAQCAEQTLESGRCDEIVNSRDQADRMLLSRSQCTDQAIATLNRFAQADDVAMNDLAAAYYVRAQRNDNPADLLNAFDSARKAVSAKRVPPGAQFNYALILEALSLDAEARDAWQRAAAEGGEWGKEAREHLGRRNVEHSWEETRAGIDAALNAHDVAKVRQLIALFPASSEKYFEEEVLPQWAASPTPQQLARVTTFADALSQFFKDPFFIDVANARSDAVRQGIVRFAAARAEEAAIHYEGAARLYREALHLLSGNPLSLLASIGYAGQNALSTYDYATELRQLDAVAAAGANYPTILTRAKLNRLFADQYSDRYNEYLPTYSAAKATYAAINDWEDSDATDAQVISTMSVLGLKTLAWRTAFTAVRDLPRLQKRKVRHNLIGATAVAALDLGFPDAALLYAARNVEEARHAKEDGLLFIALDHLAAIEVRLSDYAAAQRHLDEASHLELTPGLRKALKARFTLVEGQTAMLSDPARAVGSLTQAIDVAGAEFASFRAMLLARRADAYDRLGDAPDAKADRVAALTELHDEQHRVLQDRKRGKADDLWIPYFSRFDDTYDLLIRHLLDNRPDEAFQYAERARAYEPLDLVRRLRFAPAAFLELAKSDSVDIKKLQKVVPLNTYLIEYRVFEDRSYAWIIGRDLFKGVPLKATRDQVKRWSAALRGAAAKKDFAAFDAGVVAQYEPLLKAPLDVIHAVPGGAAANIVIVPDRELRGLPFLALRNPDTKRAFLEEHVVSFSGSALLYAFSVLRDRELVRDTSALLIGNPAFDPNSPLALDLKPLLNAEREVQDIGAFYPRHATLTGAAATPQRFLELIRDAAVVDVAAHGVINGDAPSQSYLLFRNVLSAETLAHDLRADRTRLVVLDACSSAGGLPVGAEGVAPLVRPFVGAGVPAVVGALWDVDDATAAVLLVSFHRTYRRGSDAATALRSVQLEMLRSRNPILKSGLTWAPFEVIGYASSPFPSVGEMTKEKPP